MPACASHLFADSFSADRAIIPDRSTTPPAPSHKPPVTQRAPAHPVRTLPSVCTRTHAEREREQEREHGREEGGGRKRGETRGAGRGLLLLVAASCAHPRVSSAHRDANACWCAQRGAHACANARVGHSRGEGAGGGSCGGR
eukprot:3284625-Rhodomonas_salina.1